MKYRKISELKKLENNPRTITREDMDKLVQSIKDNKDYFEARPLILSDRTGKLVILGGNQRYEAAKIAKMTEVPTHLIEGLTEAQEKEIIIRDNVSNGNWDWSILANEWEVEELEVWGVNLPSFVEGVKSVEHIREEDGNFLTDKDEYEERGSNTIVLIYNDEDYKSIVSEVMKLVESGVGKDPSEVILRRIVESS